MIRIELLNKNYEKEYERFLLESPKTLFFVSNKYRKLLKDFLQTEDCYFIALDDQNKIIGALPAFLKRNKTLGNLLNSLPFYGSNGAVIEHHQNDEIKKELLNSFYAFARSQNCVSVTLITSPFETDKDFYEIHTGYSFQDKRIGQLTELPRNDQDLTVDLMALFHSKTRNMIRKAQKSDILVSSEYQEKHLSFLIETHHKNMKVINGAAKPNRFFRLLQENFEYRRDYKIYVAFQNKTPIAALLLFYFNKTVEYFTPVMLQEYRTLQPMSLIIFEAMKDAIKTGFEWWNWGGTWLTQGGVYHFKKRWGTQDNPYFYYTKIFDNMILSAAQEQLLNNYPYFYVAPFNQLKRT